MNVKKENDKSRFLIRLTCMFYCLIQEKYNLCLPIIDDCISFGSCYMASDKSEHFCVLYLPNHVLMNDPNTGFCWDKNGMLPVHRNMARENLSLCGLVTCCNVFFFFLKGI